MLLMKGTEKFGNVQSRDDMAPDEVFKQGYESACQQIVCALGGNATVNIISVVPTSGDEHPLDVQIVHTPNAYMAGLPA